MKVAVVSALVLVAGCDGLFGLTHVPENGGVDDAAVTDSLHDGVGGRDGMTVDGLDAWGQLACSELGYTQASNGKYYRVSNGLAPQNWVNAGVDCNNDVSSMNNLHTHLVVVTSQFEGSMLWSEVLGSPMTAGGYWVGYSDLKVEGAFLWVTNETNTYPIVSEWHSGEPNGGAAENCAFENSQIELFDVPCSESHVYVCQCDMFPPVN